MAYHDEYVRNLKCKRLQVDEVVGVRLCQAKECSDQRRPPLKALAISGPGLRSTPTRSLLPVISSAAATANARHWFIDDVANRLPIRVQLTSDGLKAYLEAVEGAFGADIDYAMLVKIYGASSDSAKGRYSPPECTGAT